MTISVAGGQANGITYIMDGGTHNDPFNNLNLPTPFPDALQEFKVETSSLPARYGHHAASAVNLVTKSGTNTFHGDAVRVHPRLSLQRPQLLRPDAGQPEPQPVRRDDRRPVAQGQAVLLRRLPGQDREEQSAGNGELRADRRRCWPATSRRSQRPACSGRQITLSPGAGFSNNTISPSAFSPIALQFLQHVPVSNDPCGRLQYGIPNNNTEHQTLTRADYTVEHQPDPVRALHVRRLRQPGDLRRHQRDDPEPHRDRTTRSTRS